MSKRPAVHVTCVVRIVAVPPLTSEHFHERSELFMDELMCLEQANEDVSDMTLSDDAGELTWTVEMLVFTDDQFEALTKALTIIRTAAHTLGDGTPGWPDAKQIHKALQAEQVQAERVLANA